MRKSKHSTRQERFSPLDAPNPQPYAQDEPLRKVLAEMDAGIYPSFLQIMAALNDISDKNTEPAPVVDKNTQNFHCVDGHNCPNC